MEEATLATSLIKLRPWPAPVDGPTVSIVVTNRNGERYLKRLLAGLEGRTAYRQIELVLVDNGSTDGSMELFDRWPGRKEVVATDENLSFSEANNRGIRIASGDLVLLANNDIEPIHPAWLGYMVDSLQDDVAAVGAMLVYPAREARSYPPRYPDLTVQHIGTYFQYSQWGVRAVNMGAGQDPLSISSPGRREVPAVTAACLLARRADLLAHLLDEHYWYGSEDWDLCLRLGNQGKVIIDERAVLFHHEFGTQDQYMDDAWLARRRTNHLWFNAKWGPSVMRRLRTEITGTPNSWFFRGSDRVAIAILPASSDSGRAIEQELRRQASNAHWMLAEERTGSTDITIAVSAPADTHHLRQQDLTIAVVVDDEHRWARSGALDAAKRIVVPDQVVQARLDAIWGRKIVEVEEEVGRRGPKLLDRLLEKARPRPNALRIGVSTCAPDREKAEFWGDTYLARGLMRAFRRLGHEATELIEEDWASSAASSCDVIIHLRGTTRRPVSRGQWNLLWIISHPDRLEPGECDDYDLIASASQPHARELAESLSRPVHFLPQATDSDTFKPGLSDPDFAAPVLYVGVGRRPARRGARWLMKNQRSFHLYGRNWEQFPEGRHLRGTHIPNRDLAVAYRSAGVVVADHHSSMRRFGFVANRIADVLASGGVVLSDDVAGLAELYGHLVPTYSNPQELESQLRVLLADDGLRRRISREGRELVNSHHTLDHRARQWLRLLQEL